MMELTNKNIEEYINRFLDGETTNAEEQAIYRFFCTGNVPAHLKEYAPMFAWYEGGMQGEPKPQAMEDTKVEKRKTFSLRIPVTAWSAGIAAMVVVTLGLGLLVFSGQNLAKNHKWSCYEGSYIEVNGKRYPRTPVALSEQAVSDGGGYHALWGAMEGGIGHGKASDLAETPVAQRIQAG